MRHIPNLLTCLNLFSGCMALIMLLDADFERAAWFIGFSLAFDFADGFAARMLSASSDFGNQLDSLADVISFGVVPSAAMFALWSDVPGNSQSLAFASFLIAVFSALRLAKFNVDIRQKEYFLGLPTPANTIMIASLPLIKQQNPELNAFLANQWILLLITLFSSFILISGVPMVSFKFRSFSWKENELRYGLIGIGMALIALFKIVALPVIILCYILISVLFRKRITV